MYDFEIKRINREIKRRKAKRVLVQLPDGLKSEFVKIAGQIDAEVVLSGDPCFGACDILTYPEFDLTIHFGHAKMVDNDRVLYIEGRSSADTSAVVEKAAKILRDKRVGLITTVQHENELEKAKRILERRGIKVVVGGTVLGCDQASAYRIKDKVDEFLFIGSGRFHGLGVMYATGKKVLLADPYTGLVVGIDPGLPDKEKYIRMAKAQEARTFGVIVGSKPGQKRFAKAERIRKKLEKKRKKAYLIVMNEISPDRLDYLPFDAYIVTACPRIVLDDWKNYKKPVLMPSEV